MRMSPSALARLRSHYAVGNLIGHWRARTVKWPCAATFAAVGVTGAAIGSSIDKLVAGEFLFALAMIAVGIAMPRPRAAEGDPSVRITPAIAVRLVTIVNPLAAAID
jgi:uncharacterized protein